ncbi:MAG: hypothetical protein V4649_10635 [Bacteroidota bacterium]
MKTRILATVAAAGITALTACNDSSTTTESTTTKTDTVAAAAARQPIALSAVTPSPEFPGAALGIGAVKAEKVGADSAKVTFNFNVKNYELKMQTSDKDNKMCNNSAQGQHIHFILDNLPYKALYEPKNEVTLADNSEHYLMAFLSRSYHESIKSKGAALVYHFKIDEKGNLKKLEDVKTPMVFYSRPKGDYFAGDTTNVLLDYYIWNFEPAADGYKVKADIAPASGEATSVTLDKWEPRFINNLGTGKSKVTLTLVDKDGKQVEGPNTNVSREFNLMAQEGAK